MLEKLIYTEYVMVNKLTQSLRMQIRDEFVHGYTNGEGGRVYPTIDSLVKKHNVARATLYRWVNKEDWQQEKNRVQAEIQRQLDEDRTTNMVEQGKLLDDRSLIIAQSMLRSVARKLQKSINEEKDNPKAQLKPEHLRELSQVAINAQKIGKLALGQVQEISKVSADISNPEAFKEVLEQLDEVAEKRSSRYKHSVQ